MEQVLKVSVNRLLLSVCQQLAYQLYNVKIILRLIGQLLPEQLIMK